MVTATLTRWQLKLIDADTLRERSQGEGVTKINVVCVGTTTDVELTLTR